MNNTRCENIYRINKLTFLIRFVFLCSRVHTQQTAPLRFHNILLHHIKVKNFSTSLCFFFFFSPSEASHDRTFNYYWFIIRKI